MGKRHLAACCAVAALFFTSCQDFFTTSLASSLARNPADLVPNVTASNAAALAAQVASDPAASLIVLDGLAAVIAAASDEQQPALVALALGVASNASGVGGALLQSTGSLADLLMNGDFEDESVQEDLFAIVDSAIAGLGTLSDTAATLVSILTGTSASIDDIAATASADDLAMAAVVLLAASAADAGGVADYVDYLGTSPALNATEQLAADLAEAAAAKYAAEGGTGPLADLLAALNLTGA